MANTRKKKHPPIPKALMVFRLFRDDYPEKAIAGRAVALCVTEPGDANPENCLCYIDGNDGTVIESSAHYRDAIRDSTPCKPDRYRVLYEVLRQFYGYNVWAVPKASHWHHDMRKRKIISFMNAPGTLKCEPPKPDENGVYDATQFQVPRKDTP